MTRRDTIISAALINAGLLVVLFVCALSIDDGVQANSPVVEMTPAVHSSVSAETSLTPMPNSMASEAKNQIQEIALEEAHASQEFSTPRQWINIEVQKGDRVDKIAARYQMSVEELLHANELQTTQLVVGQRLKVLSVAPVTSMSRDLAADPATSLVSGESSKNVQASAKSVAGKSSSVKKEAATAKVATQQPKSTAPVAAKTAPKNTQVDTTSQYHYVQRGESPWVIAKKYGLTVEKLLKMNNLDEATARRLREGDRLRVR
jgi:peptidoglycan endopeptidase LytF